MHQNNHVIFGLNLLISGNQLQLQEDGLKKPVPRHDLLATLKPGYTVCEHPCCFKPPLVLPCLLQTP